MAHSVLNILITGAGAPGTTGTIYALKNNPDNTKIKVIGTDINPDCAGKYLVDMFYQIPAPNENDYIEKIISICNLENINIIIPQTTKEIVLFSTLKSKFKQMDIAVLVGSENAIELSNNKWHLIQITQKLGLPVPQAFLVKSKAELVNRVTQLGYPENNVVIKPPISNGMRGLRILSSRTLTIETFMNEKPNNDSCTLEDLLKIFRADNIPELIVSEYLPGMEYSIDVFRGEQHEIIIPRQRIQIRSGISFINKIDLREDIIKSVQLISSKLGFYGVFGFQFKMSVLNQPTILECNPRVQGTMVASMLSGANIIWYGIMRELCIKFEVPQRLVDGGMFFRNWGGVLANEDQINRI